MNFIIFWLQLSKLSKLLGKEPTALLKNEAFKKIFIIFHLIFQNKRFSRKQV
jgi:hypothetical protein